MKSTASEPGLSLVLKESFFELGNGVFEFFGQFFSWLLSGVKGLTLTSAHLPFPSHTLRGIWQYQIGTE